MFKPGDLVKCVSIGIDYMQYPIIGDIYTVVSSSNPSYANLNIQVNGRMKMSGSNIIEKDMTNVFKSTDFVLFKAKKEFDMANLTITTNNLSKKQKVIFSHLVSKNKSLALSYLASVSGFPSKNERTNLKYEINKLFNTTQKASPVKRATISEILKNFKDPKKSHAPFPTSLGEWIGVEIECFIPISQIKKVADDTASDNCETCDGDGCDDCDSQGRDYRVLVESLVKRFYINGCTVKGDGSINADSDCIPVEFSIVFKRDNQTSLKNLCSMLNRLKARVNKSCGLHVHLDSRDLFTYSDSSKTFGTEQKMKVTLRGKRIANQLQVLKEVVPGSRRTNTYCQLKMSRRDRYSAVNMTAIKKFKTIEIRLHSATTDYDKISNWITLLYDISRCKKLARFQSPSLETLFSVLYLSKNKTSLNESEQKLLEYFLSRREKFTKLDSEESSGTAA